ncbi:MAG: hypothetical protein SFX73_21205 [Kofleriaceae bacterium]|nr:hypothetical protein [Kofleriaceae bacterium]
MRNGVVIAVLFVACNNREAPRRDWSTVALDDTIESSAHNVNFTLTLPKGWQRDVNEPVRKGWRPDVEDPTLAPSVTVGAVQQPPPDLDTFIKGLVFAGGQPIVAKKIASADDLVVVRHTADHATVTVDYMTHKGDAYLYCSAFQIQSSNPKATMEWLERLCRSLTIK